MNSLKQTATNSLSYPEKTIERAERSLRVSPFRMLLFTTMRSRSVDFQEITGINGSKNQFTKRQLSELITDNSLLWLIQVGVLRREVDGQGITNSFRLTPLGHEIIDKLSAQSNEIPAASWGDRIYQFLIRWLRLPL
ncbi:Npun_F0494 family protein [Aerosakkonemataceae cyanobacterium BLCC-F154]|uniref:Npun_F0494 family protein n=1 Tax=Floridaenema fluviatile BLCC-F154 TaxID=3153640 RepID=A0ABV4YD17_9CYAN